ncbi:MAG: DUF2240 family protein [Candidatus Nanohaloarchaeota archaeon]|nr:DUF2240 family protein [Candidatus Nanohaloarchaeota archaeon]
MDEFVSLVKKLAEKTEMKEEEILEMIDKKQEEFDNIISKIGAAYIVAKELGVEIKEEKEDASIKIKDLMPGMSSVKMVVKVVKEFPETNFKRKDGSEGRVKNFLVGDETGVTRFVLWDEQIDDFDMKEGDVIEIIRAYTKSGYNDNVEIRLGAYGIIRKIDKPIQVKDKDGSDVVVREYTPISLIDLVKENENVSFKGYMVHLFKKDPIFYFCPQCNKRLKDGTTCEVHGTVDPSKLLILSGIFDDGTSSIVVNFFRRDAELLAGKSLEEVEEAIQQKGVDGFFEELEEKLLKRYYKIKGSVKKNNYSNTLEVTVHNFKIMKEVIL